MPKQFYKVNIEISNICNLQCTFCPEVIRAKKTMDLELFEKVLDQVKGHTKVVTLHLMGEPLVHPQLPLFVEACARRNLSIFFVTNGVLLKEKQRDLLLHPAFRQISFSLHSFSDNFGEKDPSEYLERIFQFTERAFVERPTLFINYRLWNLQSPNGKLAANQNILERVAKRFQAEIPEVDIREQKKVNLKGYLSLHFDEEFVWPDLALPYLSEQGTCQGLTSHFGVLVDGTVVPCCLDKEGVLPLGNLQNQPLSEILAGPKAQAMLRGFRSGKLVEPLCQRCQYVERFQPDRQFVSGKKPDQRVRKSTRASVPASATP